MSPSKEQLRSITITPLLETLALEDISDEVYFSTKYKDYVSNSRLKDIDPLSGGSPEKYFKGSPKVFTESLVFGSAVHELILQPENFFLVDDIILPPGKPGLIAEFASNAKGELPNDNTLIDYCKLVDFWNGLPSKNVLDKLKKQIAPFLKERAKFEEEYYNTHIGGGFPKPKYLNQNNLNRIHSCLDSINNNKKIQNLLHPVNLMNEELPTGNEKTILLDVEVSCPGQPSCILHLKSKLDNYSIDEMDNCITVNDVKTTSSLDFFDTAVVNFHYYREMGMYSWLLSHCAKKFFDISKPTIKSNFLAVQTTPDFGSKVVASSNAALIAGMKEFVYLLRLVAWYTINGYE